MASNSNSRRIFADVVSVDAWHDAFEGERSVADLHADVVFQEARVGGEKEVPVRFRLRLRRAEVVVVIPPTETSLRVLPNSVARDASPLAVEVHTTTTTSSGTSAEASVRFKAAPTQSTADASGSAGLSAERKATETVDVAQAGGGIIVTQSKTPDGHYRWTLQPRVAPHLEGRGWDANHAPRLKIEDRRADRTQGIPPTLQVEVRCKREDMIIDDLEVKDAATWERLKQQVGFDKRMAAAESYIRSKLASEGLEFGDLGEEFADLTIASVICDPI